MRPTQYRIIEFSCTGNFDYNAEYPAIVDGWVPNGEKIAFFPSKKLFESSLQYRENDAAFFSDGRTGPSRYNVEIKNCLGK